MRIVLIGNYPSDKQQSMQRFADMLKAGFDSEGISTLIWYPTVLFAKGIKNTSSGLGKWLGYIDKWIIFPCVLWWRLHLTSFNNAEYRFHICDHSNAPYLSYLPKNRTVITCHDVLAIRGAMGHVDAYCPAGKTGMILQTWILKHLSSARKVAAVSQFTLRQLEELTTALPDYSKDWRVIYNSFNAPFSSVDADQSYAALSKFGLRPGEPFILHVGSNLPRKNRSMLLNMVATLGSNWKGRICFAGQPLNEPLQVQAKSLGISERIVSVQSPDHPTLLALYSTCQALVFSSFSEGFGWPVIEAQACGTPVIASTVEPMPEVSGGAAVLADPTQPYQFAEGLLSLENTVFRNELIQRGFANCSRFQHKTMISAYLDLHYST